MRRTVEVDAGDVPAMDVVASLGCPRDLLDRGRVNVRIGRTGDEEFVVHDKQIVADFFDPAPVEERRSERVDVPIESIAGDLEAMLNACKSRTGE